MLVDDDGVEGAGAGGGSGVSSRMGFNLLILLHYTLLLCQSGSM